jgi:tetratricopeptide (TPR) repeat protein
MRILRLFFAAALCAAAAASCAHVRQEVRDPPLVEKLRLNITKVRHAIKETRETIARSRGAPYLPELHLRLAELLSEEARYHYQVAYEREQRAKKFLHVPQVQLLKEQAIAIYKMILRQFPGTPLAPRVLFNVGHEYRELGNYDEMITSLGQLVSGHPQSALRDEALLVLGDYYFDKNDMPGARQYYQMIAASKLGGVSGLANYKLAWVHVNLGECGRALSGFEKAMDTFAEWLRQSGAAADAPVPPGLDQATARYITGDTGKQAIDVRREALIDLAYCYSQERSPAQVVRYFRDRAYNRATYVAALDRMANRYSVMNESRGGALVTRELLRAGPDTEDRIDDARMLYTALTRSKDWSSVAADIRLITGALLRHVTRVGVRAETREQLNAEFETYARDLVTKAHEEIEKAKAAARDEITREVIGGYRAYLAAFPASEHRVKMMLNLADVLARGGDDFEAGLMYAEAGMAMKPDDKERPETLRGAVSHLQKALEHGKERPPIDRVRARAALRRSGLAVLGAGLPASVERSIKFAVAQTWYDEGHYHKAIELLQRFAYEHPGTPEATAAVHLVLDSYNAVNDFDGLMLAGRRLLAEDSPADARTRSEIRPIVVKAEQRKLDELALGASGEEGGDLSPLHEFAERHKGTGVGERALLQAFVTAHAMGSSDELNRIGAEVEKSYPGSTQLPAVFSTMAQTAIARFEFDKGIELLRRAAVSNPSQRAALLSSVGRLLEQFGDHAGARKAYLDALQSAERGQVRQDLLIRVSELLEREGDAGVTATILATYMADKVPEVAARLGLAQLAKGKNDEAEASIQQAIKNQADLSPEAAARAQYGTAEILLGTLKTFPALSEVETMQEFLGLVELAQQSYVNAIRQGVPVFAAAAFLRLAHLNDYAAGRISAFAIPASVAQKDRDALKKALDGRVQQLREASKDALLTCASQVWNGRVFNPVARACLEEKPPERPPQMFDRAKTRAAIAEPPGAPDLRQKIWKNPDSLSDLRELGVKLLDAGDPHAARLVFGKAVQSGGGPEDYNLLGLANHAAGDLTGALEAFAQAAEGGLETGRKNVAAALRKLGLSKAADEAMKRWSGGKPGGRLLP